MDRQIEGPWQRHYLWNVKNVVPFLKVDKGLADEVDGAQVMKPMPGLDALLARAVEKGVFGTKMRSVIKLGTAKGVQAVGSTSSSRSVVRSWPAGLVPILEPEIDIHSPSKAEAEQLLKPAILERLRALGADQHVMLKLTLPEVDDFYADLVAHPNVPARRRPLRRVQPRGGKRPLARQHHVVASFSRALTEGLTVRRGDEEFNAALDASIGSIFQASAT